MYKCDKCGKLHNGDFPIYTEYLNVSEGQHIPIDEYTITNCSCGGEYQEATKCPICEEYFLKEDDISCCKNCFEKNLTKENCLLSGEKYKEKFELNEFLSSVFCESEIEEILEREFDKLDDFTKRKYIRDFAIRNSSGCENYFMETIIEREKYENLYKRKN